MRDTRVLIVEDEAPVRRELARFVTETPGAQVVGRADSLKQARRLLGTCAPDLVLLDIELGDGTGFELLDALPRSFDVVFVTAYEQHAIEGFEVGAVDYLLKPVDPERLSEALDRHRRRRVEWSDTLSPDDVLFVRFDGDWTLLAVSDIVAIEADGDYTVLRMAEGRKGHVLRSLAEWEARLPARRFLRVHRSTVVNLARVDRVEPWSNHGFRLHVSGLAEPVVVSRRYAARMKDRLG